jgi:hypothetical protein
MRNSGDDDCEFDADSDAKDADPKRIMATRRSTEVASPQSSNADSSIALENEATLLVKKSKDAASKKGSKPVPLKKRKVKFATPKEPLYPFFGDGKPLMTKLTALRCLDFLDDKDLYSVSLVNHLWSKAAMDDALWE